MLVDTNRAENAVTCSGNSLEDGSKRTVGFSGSPRKTDAVLGVRREGAFVNYI
jgi:hypothetical protein